MAFASGGPESYASRGLLKQRYVSAPAEAGNFLRLFDLSDKFSLD
jgi:hypothetical protein